MYDGNNKMISATTSPHYGKFMFVNVFVFSLTINLDTHNYLIKCHVENVSLEHVRTVNAQTSQKHAYIILNPLNLTFI